MAASPKYANAGREIFVSAFHTVHSKKWSRLLISQQVFIQSGVFGIDSNSLNSPILLQRWCPTKRRGLNIFSQPFKGHLSAIWLDEIFEDFEENPASLFREYTLLEMELPFPEVKAIYYSITHLKDSVLPHDWAEKWKYKLSVADRFCYRNFVFSSSESVIRKNPNRLIALWTRIGFTLR